MKYEPKSYWERVHGRNDLSAVGQVGLSAGLNAHLHEIQRRNALRFLNRHGVQPRDVYEAGAGRGDWFPVWRAIGAQRIVAADLSDTAVRRLSNLADEAHQLDLGAPGSEPEAQYDLVAAMYVLLHIVDDDRFRTALRYLANLVKPGGYLLLAEPILLTDRAWIRQQGAESVARRLEAYSMREMELVNVRAATALAGIPIEGSRLPRALWSVMWHGLAMADRSGPTRAMAGRFLRAADPLLCRAGCAPTSKLALFKRSRQPIVELTP